MLLSKKIMTHFQKQKPLLYSCLTNTRLKDTLGSNHPHISSYLNSQICLRLHGWSDHNFAYLNLLLRLHGWLSTQEWTDKTSS